MMRTACSLLAALAAIVGVAGCSDEGSVVFAPEQDAGLDAGVPPDGAVPDGSTPDAAPDADADAPSPTQQLNFVFVHGYERTDEMKATAEDDLVDVETYVLDAIGERAVAYEAERGVTLVVQSRRLNLYTDLDGSLLSPCLDCESDGVGIVTATRWREQLVAKIEQAFPNGERNLVLVGHSTGARVSLEVATDVGDDLGPQSHDWGLGDRIAAVVTAHGAVHELESSDFDPTGPTGFHLGCVAAANDGICDYLAYLSAVESADLLASEGRALMLTSWADCGISAFTDAGDRSLPAAAMGSPLAWGMSMVPKGTSWIPAHGHLYGAFCHADPTDPSSPRHADAVASLGEHMLDWLLGAAPRVANAQSPDSFVDTPELEAATPSESYPVVADCGAGWHDLGAPEVVGICRHPDLLDGDDHVLDEEALTVTDGDACGGSFAWQHAHEGEQHAARLWYKSYSVPEGGGLLYRLPLD